MRGILEPPWTDTTTDLDGFDSRMGNLCDEFTIRDARTPLIGEAWTIAAGQRERLREPTRWLDQ